MCVRPCVPLCVMTSFGVNYGGDYMGALGGRVRTSARGFALERRCINTNAAFFLSEPRFPPPIPCSNKRSSKTLLSQHELAQGNPNLLNLGAIN